MLDSYDVFLVLERFRERSSSHMAALGPLESEVKGHLVGAEGYFDPSADTGLLVLRFARGSVELLGARAIQEMVRRTAELPMVVPGVLTAAERRSFYMEHLRRYSVYLQQYPDRHAPYPLLMRTILGLAAHSEELEYTQAPSSRDVLSELPLLPAGRPVRRRLDSVL